MSESTEQKLQGNLKRGRQIEELRDKVNAEEIDEEVGNYILAIDTRNLGILYECLEGSGIENLSSLAKAIQAKKPETYGLLLLKRTQKETDTTKLKELF